jgi:hypothetical protein
MKKNNNKKFKKVGKTNLKKVKGGLQGAKMGIELSVTGGTPICHK